MKKTGILWALLLLVPAITFAGSEKALFKAINKLDAAGVKQALADGADPNAKQLGKSALFYAVEFGHREILQILIGAKADVKETQKLLLGDERCVLSYVGPTKKEYAQWWDKYYKKYAHIDTVFDTAQFCSRYEVAEMLCKAGADVNGPGILGETPMQQALVKGYDELVGLYLKNGYNVNARLFLLEEKYDRQKAKFEALARDKKMKFDNSKACSSGLMLAITSNKPALVKLFVESGADVNALKYEYDNYDDFFGGAERDPVWPLTLAKRTGNNEIVETLTKAGAKEG